MTGCRTDPLLRIRPAQPRCLAALAGLALASATVMATPAADRVEEFAFESATLGREMRAKVVRPSTDGERPVLVLLHGRGRHRSSLLELDDAREALLMADLWVFLPDGEDGWYIDSPVDPEGRYAAYLDEFITEISARYTLSHDRHRWSVAGWSMGGYGAVRLAQRRPERFGAVAAIIGLLDFPREETLPQGRNYTVPVARFGDDPKVWRALNPLHSVASLHQTGVLVLTAEDAFDRTMNENFSRELGRAGVAHTYRMLPGGHTLDVVRAALPEVLAFVQRSSRLSTRP